jgi:hypothetical protein
MPDRPSWEDVVASLTEHFHCHANDIEAREDEDGNETIYVRNECVAVIESRPWPRNSMFVPAERLEAAE